MVAGERKEGRGSKREVRVRKTVSLPSWACISDRDWVAGRQGEGREGKGGGA
jgi:hypothetical protein